MDNITQLATALAKAQAMIDDAKKESSNPAFRSKYADLASIRAVLREPLGVNDLSILQIPETIYSLNAGVAIVAGVEVKTILLHKSGESVSCTIFMPVDKPGPHPIGSATTYARRYGISALLNVATDDDDANAAAGVNQQGKLAAPEPAKMAPAAFNNLMANARAAANGGTEAFTGFWKALTPDERAAILPEARKELGVLCKAADTAE